MAHSKEISDRFKVSIVNTYDLLKDKIFCIPFFHRSFVWKDEDIQKVFADIIATINNNIINANDYYEELSNYRHREQRNLAHDPIDKFTYFGSIHAVKANNLTELTDEYLPYYHNPIGDYYVIIDGQQRLITFSLIAGILCRRLNYLQQQLVNNQGSDDTDMEDGTEQVEADVLDEMQTLIDKLEKLIIEGNPVNCPRILRANADHNTRHRKSFASEIAAYLNKLADKNELNKLKDSVPPNSEVPFERYTLLKLDMKEGNQESNTNFNHAIESVEKCLTLLTSPSPKKSIICPHYPEDLLNLCLTEPRFQFFQDRTSYDVTYCMVDYTRAIEDNPILQTCLELIVFANEFIYNTGCSLIYTTDLASARELFEKINRRTPA